MTRINTNVSSIVAQKTLARSNAQLQEAAGGTDYWEGEMTLTRTFNDMPEHVDIYEAIYVPPTGIYNPVKEHLTLTAATNRSWPRYPQ